MPTYQKVQFIAQAIDSVRKQTLQDWELIVVDDCSTDSTQELLKYYRELDDRIIPLYRQKNYGIDATRNLGTARASAKIICVLDADDWADKHRARITYDHFRKHPDTSVFYGAFMTAEPNGQTINLVNATPLTENKLKKTGGFFEICHSVVAYPKEVWKKYPYDGGGDWEFYRRIYKDGGIFRCTEKILGAYRCGESVGKDYAKFKELQIKKRKKLGFQE